MSNTQLKSFNVILVEHLFYTLSNNSISTTPTKYITTGFECYKDADRIIISHFIYNKLNKNLSYLHIIPNKHKVYEFSNEYPDVIEYTLLDTVRYKKEKTFQFLHDKSKLLVKLCGFKVFKNQVYTVMALNYLPEKKLYKGVFSIPSDTIISEKVILPSIYKYENRSNINN